MPPRRPTRTGQLSKIARHVVLPAGIVSTGWPAVRDTCSNFGVTFDPWQDGTGRAMLAKRRNGVYAASIGGVVISIPRQVGKTFLVGAIVFALCLLHPGLTVIWTAHRMRTAGETFSKMKAFSERAKIRPHVRRVLTGKGDEAVEFHNGSRILFGARERGFGRGFDDVDVVVFDEAQILSENATDDMVPATNTAKNPLLIFMGTPPKPSDPSEVFTMKRAAALAGTARDTVFVEFSADPSGSPDDPKQWAKANPSYPTRTNKAAVLRMKANLSAESFIREGLGVWDVAEVAQIIPAGDWSSTLKAGSQLVGVPTFGLEVTEDRAWSTFAAAGVSSMGGVHGEIVDVLPGTGDAVERAARLVERNGGEVVVAKGSPAASLTEALTKAGVKVVELSVDEQARACGQFLDAVTNGTLSHLPFPALEKSVRNAVKKDHGDGGWLWSLKRSSVDITPLRALTWALSRSLSGSTTSVYEDRGMVTL